MRFGQNPTRSESERRGHRGRVHARPGSRRASPRDGAGPGRTWVGTWAHLGSGAAPDPTGGGPRPPPFMANAVSAGASAFACFRALHQPDAAPDRAHQHRRLAAAGRTQQPVRHANRSPIGAAHVALRDKDSAIKTDIRAHADLQRRRLVHDSARRRRATAIRSNLTVPAEGDLAIDLFLPGDTNTPSPLTMHVGAVQTNYVSEPGNHAGAAKLPTQTTTQNWFVIHRVDVHGPGLGRRPRRLRRFDHRWHALDPRHQQPLAGSARPPDAGAKPRRCGWV